MNTNALQAAVYDALAAATASAPHSVEVILDNGLATETQASFRAQGKIAVVVSPILVLDTLTAPRSSPEGVANAHFMILVSASPAQFIGQNPTLSVGTALMEVGLWAIAVAADVGRGPGGHNVRPSSDKFLYLVEGEDNSVVKYGIQFSTLASLSLTTPPIPN